MLGRVPTVLGTLVLVGGGGPRSTAKPTLPCLPTDFLHKHLLTRYFQMNPASVLSWSTTPYIWQCGAPSRGGPSVSPQSQGSLCIFKGRAASLPLLVLCKDLG